MRLKLWTETEQLLTLPPSFLCLASSCVMMPAEVVRTMMPNCIYHSAHQAHVSRPRDVLASCTYALVQAQM